MSFNIVVLISGTGSNLQAIIDAIENKKISGKITGIISNNSEAYGLKRAKAHGIVTAIADHKTFSNRADYDQHLIQLVEGFKPDLIVLAGFMLILGKDFVQHFKGRLINIHPSLLPKYRGLHTHEKVLAAGDKEHGVTIHFVTEELDGGPIISQEKIAVHPEDTAEVLKNRIHILEHKLYPEIIQKFAEGKIKFPDPQEVK